MEIEKFAYGFLEFISENILSVTINTGVEIDGDMAKELTTVIEIKLTDPSIIIIDRQNNYSYTGEGVLALTDLNLSGVVATGIVTYSKKSGFIANDQVKTMEYFGRTNLKVFTSLGLAKSWAMEILENGI